MDNPRQNGTFRIVINSLIFGHRSQKNHLKLTLDIEDLLKKVESSFLLFAPLEHIVFDKRLRSVM